MYRFAILPILLFYILPIAFVIWFTFSMVKLQRERNENLKEIVNEMKNERELFLSLNNCTKERLVKNKNQWG